MAKCLVCNTKKGKRKCLIVDGLICSLCCGETRKEDLCMGCSFYKKPEIKYNDFPKYSISEMDSTPKLQHYSSIIEGGICAYDMEINKTLKDDEALEIIEYLINFYHLKDEKIDSKSEIIINGVKYLKTLISIELGDSVNSEVISKILGIIRFVAKKRSTNKGEYLRLIHSFIGEAAIKHLREVMRG
jgi:hypothetical protein